jgi:hypothetical protein
VRTGERRGEVIIITMKCTRCKETEQITNVTRWEKRRRTGGKRGPPVERFNHEVVASQLLDGGTYEVYRQRRHELGLGCLSKTAYRMAELRVEAAITASAAQKEAEYFENCRTGKWKLAIAGDGSWLNRHNSGVGHYTITNTMKGKIICEITLIKRVTRMVNGKEVVITKGNYDGTSKGMEAEACRQCFAKLEKEQVLNAISTCTTDDDSSVKKIIAEDPRLAHIKVGPPLSPVRAPLHTYLLAWWCSEVCRQGPLYQGLLQKNSEDLG